MEVFSDIIMLSFLTAFVANLVHWSGRSQERWVYHPAHGWLSNALAICGFAAGVATLLWLFRVIPLQIAGFFGLLYMTTVQAYSLWFRRRERHRTV